MTPARRSRSAGFTLVELLVASVILSLVTLMLFNGMRFVNRAIAKADSRREAVESSVTGLGLLRATLGRALPLHVRVENRDRLVFEGGETRLRFATVEPDYLPGWPLVAYEYALTERDGCYLLQVRRADLDPAAPDLEALDDAQPRALLGFPAPVRFTYFGTRRTHEEAGWRGEWEAAEFLPEAVRIGPDETAPGWPDFVLPLAINTPAACLDPNAQESVGCGDGSGSAQP